MPVPNTKISLASAIAGGGGSSFIPNAVGDIAATITPAPSTQWLSAVTDLDGDGLPDFIFGAPGDDDKAVDAGRIFVSLGAIGSVSGGLLGTGSAGRFTIDGVRAGDLAGTAVGSIADLNGDGHAEILVGAPGMGTGAALDAGSGFVIWGPTAAGGLDLADVYTGNGGGYAIRGEAAGDAAGTAMVSVADLNGDGRAEVLIGAPGNDAGGTDAGAAYIVWGKASDSIARLSTVATGTSGFRIVGEAAGDGVGSVLGTISDLNGDGKADLLIGASGQDAGGAGAGAVYVVWGKADGTEVALADVAAGAGGFKINGVAGAGAGASVTSLGDINGDGLSDILIGAPGSNSAYVVYGKADGTAVDLAAVAAGVGGFRIVAEAAGDLTRLSVAGGADLNRDGIADLVIGAMDNDEGGANAGAVYVVWGGGSGTVDLSLVAQGIGGAKVVGATGSLTGATVAIAPDANGDGTADLMIGAPGSGESVAILYAPASWQPDANIYGTNGADLIGPGFGGAHVVGASGDTVLGLGGNDTIDGGGGNDSLEGGAGADSLVGGEGFDTLDGGIGADVMEGGAGDDLYVVDAAGDVVAELAGGGTDTVMSSVAYTLAAEVEALVLTGGARHGTGNALANSLTGTAGNDTLDGAAGADTMTGGAGNDSYVVDDAGDRVVEFAGGGSDTVLSSINYVLTEEVENLTLTGAAHRGTGNGLANRLTGGAGDDVLDGAAGRDTMVGGAGDDRYLVDDALDVVTELGGGGNDTVVASVDYVLGAEIETLVLTGTARSGTGNAAANRLIGTDFADTLDGAGGTDTLKGGLGDDTYRIDAAGDVVVERAGEGRDTVFASVDYALGSGSIETLVLTGAAHHGIGNGGRNTLIGTAQGDTLDGGGGVDTLKGGAGDDTYLVNVTRDRIVETASGGTDTVISTASYRLGANVENLHLIGSGLRGFGNGADNHLSGQGGHQVLNGGAGADTLDGGAGGDRMVGGSGDDVYYVDHVGDVVVEAADGGIDTVYTTVEGYSASDNVENVRLTGAAHTATGNAGDNRMSGGDGDDALDGAGGNDLLLGGGGNDTLASSSGMDTMSGGAGDDRYRVHGGKVTIEDHLGHDTIDASDAAGDSHIDLSGETDTEIENEICHIGTPPGSTAAPIDVQFLQDLTGSFADDIATVRSLVPNIVTALTGIQSDSLFGVSSFVDKPVSPFGAPGEWVYQMPLALTADPAALLAAYTAMNTLNGMDGPEAQIEALMQLALHAADVGFRADSARFVVLFTDAPFHVAGDGAAGGILTPNNGDGLTPGNGALEDYPAIAQLYTALVAANIVPIFAVAGGYEATYQGLVDQLGRGAVVTLSADSSNIVAAITAGVDAASATHIEDACGGAGNDDLIGGAEDNHLWGNGGADSLSGRDGADTLDGGAGDDNLTGGAGADHFVFFDAGGSDVVTDFEDGVDLIEVHTPGGFADLAIAASGTDTLITFGSTSILLAGVDVALVDASDFVFA